MLKYTNDQGDKVHLEYVDPMVFIDRLDRRDEGLTEITEIANDDGVLLKIYTDRAPTFYTSFDEAVLSFDAHDSTRGTGNQAGDTVILAHVKPVVDFTDPTATLPIPERMGTLVLNEAMATAAFQLRQVQDSRAERVARRQGIHLRETEPATQQLAKRKNHGRKTSSGR
jgi:hypothetical protein